jgi:hypothetical protein
MKVSEIRRLVHQLPPNCPYFRRAFPDDPAKLRNSTRTDRLAIILNDVAFGWNLGSSYAEAGLDTPRFITQTAVVRANGWLRHPECTDFNVTEAQALNMPDSKAQRDLLRALLCCRDVSLQEIAAACEIDPDVLGLFDQLFWNFRDRAGESLFVAQLLYKHTRFPGQADRTDEVADSGLRLCRLGYEKGMATVLRAAGPHPLDDGQGNSRSLHESLERELVIPLRLASLRAWFTQPKIRICPPLCR